MIIREAAEGEINAIVGLLKASLGEALTPKSEAYWRWKHVNNPFGVSPVMVAIENEQVVGVRAFMRWTWMSCGEKIETVRAVDTATHPDHQGKGIFTKLTKGMIAACAERGISVVFNTPNQKSLPGYLKMGWQKTGKLPLTFVSVHPLNFFGGLFQRNNNGHPCNDGNPLDRLLGHSGLPDLLAKYRRLRNDLVQTSHTVETLTWRYANVPNVKYHAAGVERGESLDAVVFYRVKNARVGKELRITDIFYSSKESLPSLKRIIREKVRLHKPAFVSLCGVHAPRISSYLHIPTLPVGPVVTSRSMGNNDRKDFMSFGRWSPSLGDLELF